MAKTSRLSGLSLSKVREGIRLRNRFGFRVPALADRGL